MSDQREMALDEYLASKLPDFHPARRQLQKLRVERDALAAQVEAINHPATLFIESAQDAIELLEATGEARNIVDLRQDLAEAADGLADALNNTPATSLARRDADVAEQALRLAHEKLNQRREWVAAHHLLLVAHEINEELRRQAEGGE